MILQRTTLGEMKESVGAEVRSNYGIRRAKKRAQCSYLEQGRTSGPAAVQDKRIE